jgi:hypothetical protein
MGFDFPEPAELLKRVGYYLSNRGRYTDTKPLFEQWLAILERASARNTST